MKRKTFNSNIKLAIMVTLLLFKYSYFIKIKKNA